MIRLALLCTSCTVFLTPAFAQSAPTIPAPAKQARIAQYIPAPDRPSAALPTGRSRRDQTVTHTRSSGYAGERPQAYAQPIGQQVYTSRTVATAAPAPTGHVARATSSGIAQRTNAAVTLLKGLRGEVRVGYDSVHTDGTNGSASDQAVVYGLGLGYDYDIGNMFVGGFISFDWSGAGNDVATQDDGTPPTDYTITTEVKEDLELGIRAGFWTRQNINLYGLLAWTQTTNDVTFVNLTDDPDPTDDDRVVAERKIKQDGYRIGAGSEVTFPHGIYGKAEYRYSDYGDDPAIPGNDMDRHQLMTGVGMRF